MLRFLLPLLLLAGFVAPRPAGADSWVPPQTETYVSADGSHRLTVTPRAIRGALPYFEDKVEGREPAGQSPGGAREARALLERREADGRWREVWQRALPNDVAPVRALVADGGRYVATFDNWHSLGFGDNVVVIYGEAGRLIRSFRLDELLSDDEIERLPRSVSSIAWGGEHRFSADGTRLVLKIARPGSGRSALRYDDLEIDLPSGRPLERTPKLQ